MKKHSLLGINIFHSREDNSYEGSHHDWRDDHVGAARRGQTTEDYEDSARDRIQDKAGEKRMKERHRAQEAIKDKPSYKAGASAFANRPKMSHGYGHKDSQRQGHLRMSGSSGAHRIGKKG